MRSCAVSGMLATVLSILGTSGLMAQSQSPEQAPSASAIQAADRAFHAGYAAVQSNDLKGAEANFAQVVRLTPAVAAGHAAYGSVLLSLGKLDEAIHQLELAHNADPEESSAALNLARAYEKSGHPELAMQIFDSLSARTTAMTPETWYEYAQLLLAAGKLPEARQKMIAATEAYPQNAMLADTLGVVLARQQDYPAAEDKFRHAAELEQAMVEPHLHLATTLLIEKRVPEAIAEAKIAAGLRPQDPAVLLELGRALTADRQDQAALDTLQQALKLSEAQSASPGTFDIKYALAIALQNSGRNQDALPLFREVAAARPDDAAALTNLGLTLVELGKAKEALPFYNRALTLNAHDWILQQDLGVAYLQQSDLKNAIQHFQDGLAIDPNNAQLHYDLGLAYKLKDSLPEAITAFTQAEEEDPALADTPYTLGVLYMQTGRFADAQSELQKATTLRPENGDAWSVLGSVDKSLNQADQAVRDLLTAIRLQPASPGNHITLAAIYAQQGRRDEATAERRIAADLSRAAVNKQKASFALESGRAFLKQGRVEEAITQISVAIGAAPENPDAHLAMADALAAQGKTADAALERQKAAALGIR